MPWNEKLYERRLRRPLDEPTRRAISLEFSKRRHQIPMPTELHWHESSPRFTIKGPWLSFVVHFTAEVLIVNAELTLAAKLLATEEHRRQAVQFIELMANDLNL
jgi:hypothetical protein